MKYCLQPCREEVSAGNPAGLLLPDPWSTRIFHFSSFTAPTCKSSAALEQPTGPGDARRQLAGGAEAADSGTRARKGQQRSSGATLESGGIQECQFYSCKTEDTSSLSSTSTRKQANSKRTLSCVCVCVCVFVRSAAQSLCWTTEGMLVITVSFCQSQSASLFDAGVGAAKSPTGVQTRSSRTSRSFLLAFRTVIIIVAR